VTYRWIRGEMAKQPDTYQLDAGGAVQGSDLALAGLRDSAEEMSAAD
jgi:hypothetical protein